LIAKRRAQNAKLNAGAGAKTAAFLTADIADDTELEMKAVSTFFYLR
jgi:hypothetical protein